MESHSPRYDGPNFGPWKREGESNSRRKAYETFWNPILLASFIQFSLTSIHSHIFFRTSRSSRILSSSRKDKVLPYYYILSIQQAKLKKLSKLFSSLLISKTVTLFFCCTLTSIFIIAYALFSSCDYRCTKC